MPPGRTGTSIQICSDGLQSPFGYGACMAPYPRRTEGGAGALCKYPYKLALSKPRWLMPGFSSTNSMVHAQGKGAMVSQSYFRFIENNDHEGEVWNFFVPLTPEQAAQIRALVDDWECYELEERTYSEAEVEQFLQHRSSTTYMTEYNRCAPLFVAIPDTLEEDDIFYKGAAFQVLASCKPR